MKDQTVLYEIFEIMHVASDFELGLKWAEFWMWMITRPTVNMHTL